MSRDAIQKTILIQPATLDYQPFIPAIEQPSVVDISVPMADQEVEENDLPVVDGESEDDSDYEGLEEAVISPSGYPDLNGLRYI